MRLLVAVVHAGGLAVAAAIGGGGWGLVGVLVGWQVLEAAVAVDRDGDGDLGALALGVGLLAVVVGSLVVPGVGNDGALALVVAGAVLRLWAIRTLGPAFLDGVAPLLGQARVRTGPYRWVAHPADLGLALVVVGVVAATGSWVGAGVGALVLVGLFLRTRAEERAWTAAGSLGGAASCPLGRSIESVSPHQGGPVEPPPSVPRCGRTVSAGEHHYRPT